MNAAETSSSSCSPWTAFKRSVGVVMLCAAIPACTTARTTEGGAIGVNRTQRFSPLVAEQQLNQGAEQAYAEMLQKNQAAGKLNAEPQLTQRVRAVAQRIIPQTQVFRKDAANWKWEVNVFQSDELNAWCMPGGKIGFYSGIIHKLKLSDDEIAAIMGHEVAHALREHARERASEKAMSGLLIGLGSAVAGVGDAGAQLTQFGYDAAFGMKHSRAHETEADRIGVELAARAGYDPRAAIVLWQKMQQVSSGGGGHECMSTHPSAETRIADLQDYSQRVMPLYQQAARGR